MNNSLKHHCCPNLVKCNFGDPYTFDRGHLARSCSFMPFAFRWHWSLSGRCYWSSIYFFVQALNVNVSRTLANVLTLSVFRLSLTEWRKSCTVSLSMPRLEGEWADSDREPCVPSTAGSQGGAWGAQGTNHRTLQVSRLYRTHSSSNWS